MEVINEVMLSFNQNLDGNFLLFKGPNHVKRLKWLRKW
jgi:hypothetical protein